MSMIRQATLAYLAGMFVIVIAATAPLLWP